MGGGCGGGWGEKCAVGPEPAVDPEPVAAGRKRDRDEEGEDKPLLKKVKMLLGRQMVIERHLAELSGWAECDASVAMMAALEECTKETTDRQRLDLTPHRRHRQALYTVMGIPLG